MGKFLATGVLVLGLSISGCASGPVPVANANATSAAIRAAKEVGAPAVPTAALHLKLAEDQSEMAQKMIKEGNNGGANMMYLRADADAELALSLAREVQTVGEAQKAQQRVLKLAPQAQ